MIHFSPLNKGPLQVKTISISILSCNTNPIYLVSDQYQNLQYRTTLLIGLVWFFSLMMTFTSIGISLHFILRIPVDRCKFNTQNKLFNRLNLSWNNEGTGFTWTWNCLSINWFNTFAPGGLQWGKYFLMLCWICKFPHFQRKEQPILHSFILMERQNIV